MPLNAGFPLDFPLLFLILLLELLFGIGFNQLVEWAHQHNLWHVAVSVICGTDFRTRSSCESWQQQSVR